MNEKEYIPYSYIVKQKDTGLWYYGIEYAQKSKIANPENLWKTYFTSSKEVHTLIEEYGIDSFDAEVRQTFKTAEEANKWEKKVLSKIFKWKNNINKNAGGYITNKGMIYVNNGKEQMMVYPEHIPEGYKPGKLDKYIRYGYSTSKGLKEFWDNADEQWKQERNKKVSERTKEVMNNMDENKKYEMEVKRSFGQNGYHFIMLVNPNGEQYLFKNKKDAKTFLKNNDLSTKILDKEGIFLNDGSLLRRTSQKIKDKYKNSVNWGYYKMKRIKI